jgi:DNA transposition AAA+ family ATPase
MTDISCATFIETKQYQRFAEFCDACCRYRYIGLCYGPPGVGKTLSARYYAKWDAVEACRENNFSRPILLKKVQACNTVFYTPGVVNSPKQVEWAITDLRNKLRQLISSYIRLREDPQVEKIQELVRRQRKTALIQDDWYSDKPNQFAETDRKLSKAIEQRTKKLNDVKDPTKLIIVDEADRLKISGLEELRELFDSGGIGLIIIGMPGLEKRCARFPQLYSRVGFVHEFRPLSDLETRTLLQRGWSPEGVNYPKGEIAKDVLSAILRITGGNFRLLDRLLTQIARVLEINKLRDMTLDIVEAARETLVIGTV